MSSSSLPAAGSERPPAGIDQERRRFLGVAATALATTWLGAAAEARVQVFEPRTAGMASPTLGTLKQIEAGVLNVGYVETGAAKGPVVLLLHGWPYDVHTYAEVAPRLGSAGYRVIVPYLRGYGSTLFRSSNTIRNGQQSALGLDALTLMDALRVRQAIIGGVDWGARTANIMAALWPERCKAMVSVSGYLIGNRAAAGTPLVPEAEYQWWYQYYFATERGRAGYDKYRREFARLIWRLASPRWRFDDATFEASAAAFDNPDHVAIVIHNYRWRLGLAQGETHYDELERRLALAPVIKVPTITLEGGCQRGAASGRERVCRQVRPHVRAPGSHGWRRAQPAAGGAGGVRAGHHGRRSVLMGSVASASCGSRVPHGDGEFGKNTTPRCRHLTQPRRQP